MGSVDFFHYEDCVLNTVGWAFDPTFQEMGQPRIAFYAGTEKLQESPLTTIYRMDVAQAIGNPDAESAVFPSRQRFWLQERLRYFWSMEILETPGDFFLAKCRHHPDRRSFWFQLLRIPGVWEISDTSNSVMCAV